MPVALVCCVAGLLAACGAREALPVSEVSPLDGRLSCEHLAGELGANEARVAELRGEGARRTRDSVGLALVSPASGLLLLDNGRTQSAEVAALLRRNERVRSLQRERGCPAP